MDEVDAVSSPRREIHCGLRLIDRGRINDLPQRVINAERIASHRREIAAKIDCDLVIGGIGVNLDRILVDGWEEARQIRVDDEGIGDRDRLEAQSFIVQN